MAAWLLRTVEGSQRVQASGHGPTAATARSWVGRENRGEEDGSLLPEKVATARH
jgi:hypothetical protein